MPRRILIITVLCVLTLALLWAVSWLVAALPLAVAARYAFPRGKRKRHGRTIAEAAGVLLLGWLGLKQTRRGVATAWTPCRQCGGPNYRTRSPYCDDACKRLFTTQKEIAACSEELPF